MAIVSFTIDFNSIKMFRRDRIGVSSSLGEFRFEKR